MRNKYIYKYNISGGIPTYTLKIIWCRRRRLRPHGHADSLRNKLNYSIFILNMLKEKILYRQSRESVVWQLFIVSC